MDKIEIDKIFSADELIFFISKVKIHNVLWQAHFLMGCENHKLTNYKDTAELMGEKYGYDMDRKYTYKLKIFNNKYIFHDINGP